MTQNNAYVVFDVETQRGFDEVGGQHNRAQMGISVAVLYDSRDDQTYAFREHELDGLVDALRAAPLVIGFNILHFDYPVLQPYTDFDLRILPSLDLLHDLHRRLGFRVSLDNLAQETLRAGKSGSGLEAIQLFRQQNWEKLIAYCRDDVLITRDLFRFGQENGYVKFWDRLRKRSRTVSVAW